MLNLANTKRNSFTGVHMLQRHAGGYRVRCNRDTLKKFTSVDVKPRFISLFGAEGEGIYHSELFGTIPEGAQALCEFIEKVCGVPCHWKPQEPQQ